MRWEDIKTTALEWSKQKPDEYRERLLFEFKEIEKQATQEYWEDLVKKKKKFSKNPNGLILPFALGITDIDPIQGENVAYIGDGRFEMEGIEIEFENGKKISLSANTKVKTSRGMVLAMDLLPTDDIICEAN